MPKIEVTGFDNRGTRQHPHGFIEFSDGMRIGYAPGTRQADADGLFNCQQPHLLRDEELRAAHVTAARKYVREVLTRKQYRVEAIPEGETFWVLRIHGLPEGMVCVTQAEREKGEQEIEATAREFIALMLEVDEKSFDLEIEIENTEGDNA